MGIVALVSPAACGGGDDSGGAAQGTPAFTFNVSCSACHGADGRGVSAPTLIERDLTRAGIDQQVRAGRGRMPAFQGRLSDEEIRLAVERVVELRTAAGQTTPP